MDLFTNGVGRPSNETIKKRNIFKGICVILALIVISLLFYMFGGYNKQNSKEDHLEQSINAESTTNDQTSNETKEISLLCKEKKCVKTISSGGKTIDIEIEKTDYINYLKVNGISDGISGELDYLEYNDKMILIASHRHSDIGDFDLEEYKIYTWEGKCVFVSFNKGIFETNGIILFLTNSKLDGNKVYFDAYSAYDNKYFNEYEEKIGDTCSNPQKINFYYATYEVEYSEEFSWPLKLTSVKQSTEEHNKLVCKK